MRSRPSTRSLGAWCSMAFVVLMCATSALAFDRSGQIRLDDLNLLGVPTLAPGSPLEQQAAWALRFANGLPADRADVQARFTPRFQQAMPIDELVRGRDRLQPDWPFRVWAVERTRPDFVSAVIIGRTGVTYRLAFSTDLSTARIDSLTFDALELTRQPMAAGSLSCAIAAALGLALVGSLMFHRPRLDRRPGAWMLAAAVACSLQGVQLFATTPALVVGQLAGPLAVALVAWVLLRDAASRALRRLLAIGAIVAASAAVVAQFSMPTAAEVVPWFPCFGSSRSAALGLLDARAGLVLAVALGIGGVLIIEAMRHQRPQQVASASAGVAASAISAMVAASWLLDGRVGRLTMSAWLDVALLTVAAGHAAGVFIGRLELGGVARLVTDLGAGEAPQAIEALVRQALEDPSAEVWYWSEELDGYASVDGRLGNPEALAPGRVATRLSSRGQPLAVVVHNAALAIADHRVAAVCAAARMALDNERLQAQVRAQLSEARASRARIVHAADQARREIERNLHDGAQQRLLAVLVHLRRAEGRYRHAGGPVDGSPPADELASAVSRASEELAVALAELRAIARGLHPPALDHGLEAALETLAETAPLPVELSVGGGITTGEPVLDAAVYFFVSEALANTVRHAGASHLAVAVQRTSTGLQVTATDDGCGGAALDRGTGLARLADRAVALGGRLSLDSPPLAGTTVVMELPVAPHPTAGLARA